MIIQALQEGNSVVKACEIAGVRRRLYYDWLIEDPEFAKEVEKAKMSRNELVEDALFREALKGNVTAIIFFLANRVPHRWRNIQKISGTGEDVEIEVIMVDGKDKEKGKEAKGMQVKIKKKKSGDEDKKEN